MNGVAKKVAKGVGVAGLAALIPAGFAIYDRLDTYFGRKHDLEDRVEMIELWDLHNRVTDLEYRLCEQKEGVEWSVRESKCVRVQ